MAQAIRVLHFADIHIGMENYGKSDPNTGLSSRVVDFLRRMDEMIESAREEEVDLVIFAGDAFKTRAPNPTYQREFAHRIRDLSEMAPVIMLVGNHDLPPTLMKASSIEIYDTLRVPNIRVANNYEVFPVETKRGPVAVGTAPYPVRSRILEEAGTAGKTIAETDELLQQQMSQILEDLAAQADTYDMPRLLTAHFTITGATVGSEKHIMLGRDIQMPLTAVADARWDYVALGHVHKHQNLSKGQKGVPPVVYSGSMERIDFGEEGDPKGYCWAELKRGKTVWEFRPSPHVRPFITLRQDLRESTNPTEQVLKLMKKHDLHNAVVRIELDLSLESDARFNEATIREQLRHAGVFQIAGIRRKVEQPVRARLGTSPEGLTHAELLEKYLLSRETPGDRREQLLAMAESVFEQRGQD